MVRGGRRSEPPASHVIFELDKARFQICLHPRLLAGAQKILTTRGVQARRAGLDGSSNLTVLPQAGPVQEGILEAGSGQPLQIRVAQAVLAGGSHIFGGEIGAQNTFVVS